MMAEDFDITSILEVSYGEENTVRAPQVQPLGNSTSRGGEVVLGLVPAEDWVENNPLKKEEDKEIEAAERKLIYGRLQQGRKVRIKQEYEPENEKEAVVSEENEHGTNSEELQESAAQDSVQEREGNRQQCGLSVAAFAQTVSQNIDAEQEFSEQGYYACTTCSISFSDASLLGRHSRTHPPRRKPFSCNMCGKSVTELSNLKRHVRFHTGEAAIPCNICHQMFHTPDMLRAHMRVHSGQNHCSSAAAVMTLTCPVCMRPFYKEGFLKRHIRIHSSEKRFLQTSIYSPTSTSAAVNGYIHTFQRATSHVSHQVSDVTEDQRHARLEEEHVQSSGGPPSDHVQSHLHSCPS